MRSIEALGTSIDSGTPPWISPSVATVGALR